MLSGKTKVDAITGDWLSEVIGLVSASNSRLKRPHSSISHLEVFRKKRE